MSDILQTILNGVSKRLKDMGDGSYAEVVYNINGGGGGGGSGTVDIDQTTPGTSNGVVAKPGENHIGEVGARTIIAAAGVTRPADTNAYAVGDLIANSTTAGSVTPMALAVGRVAQGTGMLRRVRLKVNDTAWANGTVRVHIYKNSPTCANGDNGVWSTSESEYLGSCDVTFDRAFSDPFVMGVGVPAAGSEINFDCAASSQNIYALLEARSAVTPGSGKAFEPWPPKCWRTEMSLILPARRALLGARPLAPVNNIAPALGMVPRWAANCPAPAAAGAIRHPATAINGIGPIPARRSPPPRRRPISRSPAMSGIPSTAG